MFGARDHYPLDHCVYCDDPVCDLIHAREPPHARIWCLPYRNQAPTQADPEPRAVDLYPDLPRPDGFDDMVHRPEEKGNPSILVILLLVVGQFLAGFWYMLSYI